MTQRTLSVGALFLTAPVWAVAAGEGAFAGPHVGPVPLEFILFGCVLAGVALFHHYTLRIAMGGAIFIALYKIVRCRPSRPAPGSRASRLHLGHEWVILANLLLLLLGFALLADLFEKSEVPRRASRGFLPDDWTRRLRAAAAGLRAQRASSTTSRRRMIGGAMRHTVFKGKVHIGLPGGHRGRLQRAAAPAASSATPRPP